MTNQTSLTLLDRLQSEGRAQDWELLNELYRPLLQSWAKRFQVQGEDAEDLTQEVLLSVVRALPEFEHNGRPGAFRNWLRTMMLNRVRHHWRQRRKEVASDLLHQQLQELEDEQSAMSRLWAEEHDRHLLDQLLKIVRKESSPQTWEAFERTAIQNKTPKLVAEELEISVNSVMVAKSRVLAKLRAKAQGMLEL